MSPISVVPYDPNWPVVFEALREGVWRAVREFAIRIEHVGSTSVPGLAAKAVIDMDVVVHSGDIRASIGRLEAIGYRHLGDRGIPQREAFEAPPASAPHHLYVCPAESPALRNHLVVRDYLRANPVAANAYAELKMGLAAMYADDIEGYIEGKSDFLAEVLSKAGFEKAGVEDIRRVNRRREERGP